MRSERLWIAAAVVALLVGFVDKPLHVDDPVYVWVAQQIQETPADFYRGTLNWYGIDQPVAEVNENPPLVSYFFALWAALFGFGERSLHVASWLPAVALALGIHALGRRWTRRPALAALAAVTTPVVLVSATTLMSDVPMLAFYVWAVFFWVRGVDERRPRDLVVAAALAAASALTKYFGVSLVPLLAAYAIAARRRPGPELLALALPLAVLAGYELYTASLYGAGHLLSATLYSSERALVGDTADVVRIGHALLYAGGCVATLLVFAPFLAGRRGAALGAGLAALAVAGGVALGARITGDAAGDARWILLAQLLGFVGAAALAIALVVSDLWRRRDRTALLLALWVAGTFVFVAAVNWTISARAVAPMAPALALLVARRIDDVGAPLLAPTRPRLAAALGVAAVASLVVAHGDREFARAAREAAERIHADHAGETIWFEGHWGFQEYMQRLGARHTERRRETIATGDLIALPGVNSGSRVPPAELVEPVEQITLPQRAFAWTLGSGAGFYSTRFGGLPYRIGAPPEQTYAVLRALHSFRIAPPGGGRWIEWATARAQESDWKAVLEGWEASGRLAQLGRHAVQAAYGIGDPTLAHRAIDVVRARAPHSDRILFETAHAAAAAGDAAAAAPIFQRLLELAPDRANYLNEYAWLLATARDPAQRDPARAVELARRAVAADGSHPDPNHLDTLAVALAESGDRAGAAEAFERAAEAAAARGDAAGAAGFRERAAALRAPNDR